jgi:hypothetical protein
MSPGGPTSTFSLAGMQPVKQTTFKPPEVKGERLLESERQGVDELADRLTGNL